MRSAGFLRTVTLLLTISLAACGGGSENSPPTSVSPTPTLSVISSGEITVHENSSAQATININYTGSDAVVTSLSESGIESLTARLTLVENTVLVNVSAGELLGRATEQGSLSVSVTAGSLTETIKIPIKVVNTSFDTLMEDVTRQLESVTTLSVSRELRNISTYLADKAYLYGVIDNEKKEEWLNTQNENAHATENNLRTQISESLIEILNNRDTITEHEALNMLGSVSALIHDSGELFMSIIDSYAVLNVPNFSLPNSLIISPTSSGYSLFYGNPAVGSSNDGNWNFSDQFSILSSLIPTNGTLCLVSNNE